jgi:hypothetical protein
MGALKTFLVAMTLSLPVQAGEMAASFAPADDQLVQFATCAGRLSALMEHQWLIDGPASERTAKEVAAFSDLVQALIAPDQGRRVLALRIEAKVAQRALLMQADFGRDPRLTAHAARRATELIGACRAMVLS